MLQNQEDQDFNEILQLLDFPSEIRELIKSYYIKNSKRIKELSKQAYEGEAPNFPLCKRKPFTRLVIVIYKLIEVKKKYQSLSISGNIFKDTIHDVSLRAQLYKNHTNLIGLDINSTIWFRHIFNIHIFKLGAIQFQLFSMVYLDEEFIGEPYMTFSPEWKEQLPIGAPVINVHIQKGADLTPEGITDSFLMAGEFFQQYFPSHDYRAFICCSWFLYPGLKQLLPEDSRIVQFADRFLIIGSVQDNEEAIRRIFGHRYRSKKNYPQETSLQRNALDKMKLLGEGYGVILR